MLYCTKIFRNPLSTLIFTLNALFTKPAISLAPIIIVSIINRAGIYDAWKDADKRLDLEPNERNSVQDSMFICACFYPLVLAVLQVFLMLPYRLKFYHHEEKNKIQLTDVTVATENKYGDLSDESPVKLSAI